MRNTSLMRPWTRKITELLADGEWHDREQVLAIGAAAVPPGIAFRRGELDRARKRPLGPGPRVRGDRATSIATGARTIVQRTIDNQVRQGLIERSAGHQSYRRTSKAAAP